MMSVVASAFLEWCCYIMSVVASALLEWVMVYNVCGATCVIRLVEGLKSLLRGLVRLLFLLLANFFLHQ